MKIILSRKGFDSAYGGFPSPILPNGRMISLPIPSGDVTKYSDLIIDGKHTYFDLMMQLRSKIRYEKLWHNLTRDTKCHLDPDLCKRIIQRNTNWKPCFGQINQAQSHLQNEDVKEGDLFIFFGWFRKTIIKNGIFQFDKSIPDLHIIFGYLQIGEILKVNNETKIPKWMQNHPHARDESRKTIPTNTIYVSRDCLTWDKSRPGAGTFRYSDNLVLTKKGFSRSKWELPAFFRRVKISRHSRKSWNKDGSFQSVAIGQEFVIEDSIDVENWAKQIVNLS